MEIGKVTVVYWSPTGGTKKTALLLTEALKGLVEECDITDYDAGRMPHEFSAQELVVFAVPVYGGRVPEPAMEKIRLMSGNKTPAVLMAVYGNRACDDALLELKNLTDNIGFVTVAAVMAVAEHSVMRRFAAGRPDVSDEKELKKFGEEIKKHLSVAPGLSDFRGLSVPGNEPYREYNGIPLKPKAGKTCTGCGICVLHCPVQAIPAAHPEETDMKRCISCMRCIAVCPNHARDLNKFKLAVAEKAMEKSFKERRGNILIIETTVGL